MKNKLDGTNLTSLHVKVVSDMICPFCVIGLRNLQTASLISGVALSYEFEPFLLNPKTLPEDGIPLITHLTNKFGQELAEHFLLDTDESPLTRQAREVGLHLNNKRYMYPSVKAHLLVEYVKEMNGNHQKLMEVLFQHYFVQGDNINDIPTLIDIAKIASDGTMIVDPSIFLDTKRIDAIYKKDEEYKTGPMKIVTVPFFIIEGCKQQQQQQQQEQEQEQEQQEEGNEKGKGKETNVDTDGGMNGTTKRIKYSPIEVLIAGALGPDAMVQYLEKAVVQCVS